ncbi:MAG: hypothetical protein AMXMBFR82_46790 [Candidatus Hydrogenedentota bacterium]
MRVFFLIAMIALALTFTGCETTSNDDARLPLISASGKSAADRGTVFLKVFVDEDARAKAPVDMQISIDDKPVINRSFTMGRNSDDGQFQITLPTGTHTLSATSQGGLAQIRKRFRVRKQDEKFIELYVTDQGRVRLTRDSKIRIIKFVIKNYSKPQQKNFNPAMWMRLSALDAEHGPDYSQRGALTPIAGMVSPPAQHGFRVQTTEGYA